MGGKITDTQLLATLAAQKLKDIAATEGHDYVPSEQELEEYLAKLGPDENPFKNQQLETRQSGRGIADFFRRK